MPAKTGDSPSCAGVSVFTHSTPFCRIAGYESLVRLAHTRRVGGVSVTLVTALAVKPARPPAPSVVITFTAAPRRAIASRQACFSTGTSHILHQFAAKY